MRRLPVVLVLAALLAGPAVGIANASPSAARTAPGAALGAPPAQLRLVFGSPVETAFLRLVVTGPDGRRVSGPARRDPVDPQAVVAGLRPGPRGAYRVAWRVFSQDGHPARGAYRFTARAGAAAGAAAVSEGDDDAPLAVAGRLLALVGPLGLLGLVVVRYGVVGPAWRSGGPRPPGARRDEGQAARTAAVLERAAGRWWACWWGLCAAWALGLALLPAALLRALDAGPGGLGTLLGDTRWGRAAIVQAAALLASLVAGAALARGPEARRPSPRPAWAVALGLPPALAALAVSWSGHASAGSDRAVSIGLDALHSWATAVWLGGLVGLAALVAGALPRLGEQDRVRLGAGVVVRFSALAVAAVGVLVVTGVYRALAELSSLADLVDTGYGRALLVKLGVFAVLLAGGAYNRLVVHPRLERAALGLEPGDRGAAAALRISLGAELALGGVLMVVVAVLVSLPPP